MNLTALALLPFALIASSLFSVAAGKYQKTPEGLVAAIHADDLAAVRELVLGGVSPNRLAHPKTENSYGDAYPIESASAGCRTEILKFLLGQGAKPNPPRKKNDLTPVHYAAAYDCSEGIKILIAAGSKFDASTDGDTPLIKASYAGHMNSVRILVEAGASLKSVNKDGDTPYRAAHVFGNHGVAQYLRSVGGK
jgi:ankyrin repeat protein